MFGQQLPFPTSSLKYTFVMTIIELFLSFSSTSVSYLSERHIPGMEERSVPAGGHDTYGI